MTTEELKTLVAESMSLGESKFDENTDLRSLPGYDSVNLLMLLVELEDQAGVHLPVEQAACFNRLQQVIDAAREQGTLDE